MYIRLLSVVLLLTMAAPVIAGKTEITQEVLQALKAQGDPAEEIWLDYTGGRFPILYTASSADQAKGGVLLVHDVRLHPDWPGVVHPLRTGLPDLGWHTLVLRTPAPRDSVSNLPVTRALEDGGERISAGLAHFKQQNILNVVLVGYGWGAAVATRHLTGKEDPGLVAVVTISPHVPGRGTVGVELVPWLKKIKLPILDVFGSRDLPQVRMGALKRLQTGRSKDGFQYQQIVIDGADHDYTGFEEVLVKRIRGWLKVNAIDPEIESESAE